jgi:hypothetical protein
MTELRARESAADGVPEGGAKILPTNEAMAQALQNEEVGICIMWKARAVQWQKAGAKVETVAPKEGIPLYISGFVIPKNAPNKDGAHVWLNEMLQPSAQEAFAEDMGYNGSVTNAKIPPETEKADRLQRRRAQAIDRSRLRLSREERRRAEGVVGQDVQGLSSRGRHARLRHADRVMEAAVPSPGKPVDDRSGCTARAHGRARMDGRRDGRARIDHRDDRHRAADRHPVSLQPQPVHAGQGDGRRGDARELRQVLHRSILRRGSLPDDTRGGAVHGDLRRAGLPDGPIALHAHDRASRTCC